MSDSDYDLQIKEFEAAKDIASIKAHKEMDCSYVIKWEYLQCWKEGADWGRNYERNWFWNQGHNLLAKNNEIKGLKAELSMAIQDRDSWKNSWRTTQDAANRQIAKLDAEIESLGNTIRENDHYTMNVKADFISHQQEFGWIQNEIHEFPCHCAGDGIVTFTCRRCKIKDKIKKILEEGP